MGRIYNIPFEGDFIDNFTKKVLGIAGNFQTLSNSLVIVPHERFKNAFSQQKTFRTSKGILLPKIITFASINENILEFSEYCKDLSKFIVHSLKTKIIGNDQLTILLTSIVESLKQESESLEFDSDFLNTLNIGQLKKAILECYYYQYDLDKIFPYSRNEKVLFRVIKKLESYLKTNCLSLKPISLNNAVSAIVEKWNYGATKKIFIVLPQTDVKYVSLFLDSLNRYNNAFIFIRGLNRKLCYKTKIISKNHHQHHIADFLHRNQIMLNLIEDISIAKVEKPFIHLITESKGFNVSNKAMPSNISIISAKDQNEEAKIVSLITREQLAKGLKNIVIQTKSAGLAIKIENFLKFWNIAVDNLVYNSYKDNQEIMLFLMVGHYLNLTENDYLLLLDILKSDFCKFNDNDELKEFELDYLRKYSFRERVCDYFKDSLERKKFLFLIELEQIVTTVRKEIKAGKKNLYEYFQIHLKIFNFLKDDCKNTMLEKLLLNIEENFKMLNYSPSLKFSSYIKILEEVLQASSFAINVTPNCPVKILQTLETRNIQYDILIFAGLNEGIFPNANLDHGYFHPYTRVASKLKLLDTDIGFMEYDFISSLFNKNVVLSYSVFLSARSSKCRWLERILVCKEARQKSEVHTKKYRGWLQSLYHGSNKKNIEIKYVNMNVNLRPDKISVSGIERLISNPYMYYAKDILKLNCMEDIARQPGKKEFGIILHNIMSHILCKDFNHFEKYADKFNSLFLQVPKSTIFLLKSGNYGLYVLKIL